jgi:hemoglobin-like flavoprotein
MDVASPQSADSDLRARVLQEARQLMATQNAEIARSFYAELLRRHPGMAAHFDRLDLAQQARKLTAAIQLIVGHAENRTLRGYTVVRTGLAHAGRSIGAAEYGAFTEVLAETLARAHRDVPESDALRVWQDELQAIAEVMMIVTEP